MLLFAVASRSTLLLPMIPVMLYLVLVAVVALVAVLHPHRDRRAAARRVLVDLLTVLRRR
ncbi:hypothetical protein ACFFX1_11045 [Dactylosporangium sucinum]|uniref:Uncharacterized protein n=1 Tax=Dactylosporangium sucinum TaxID=1424081 RepID=A0A917TH14_9ACTN|nr:hypothetical protein [Dactylosporangium sucinum]GGM22575.1 hypothetical protein GCM10007977_024680 [Dactylosporangium sucinum]